MRRYCANCKKEFEFTVKSIHDMDNLKCPECGSDISKLSMKPDDTPENKKAETRIGRALAVLFRLSYIFYMVVAAVGIASYFLKYDTVLYVCAGIDILVYILQWLMGYGNFRAGWILIPAGAVAGYLIFKTVQGAAMCVLAVFFIRHLIRDIIYRIIWMIIRWARSC